MTLGTLHHVELRTADLDTAAGSWGWLLGELGYEPFQQWDHGRSWRLGPLYVVLESTPLDGDHDRRRRRGGSGLQRLPVARHGAAVHG
ncbi:hypothetical protein [Curtobacterium flaccumfaciens]|uniref:hypothetical protein n=1 Tax=Curtobacterium flaccumfaciens TaxID=2035 RepID=UPI003992EE31